MFAKKRKGQTIIYGILIILVAAILFAAIGPLIQEQINNLAPSLDGMSQEGVKLIIPFAIIFLIFLPLVLLFARG